MLSPDGRSWLDGELERERAAVDVTVLNGSYDSFMELNHAFKELVSNWQTSGATAEDAEPWGELLAGVGAVDEGIQRWCGRLSSSSRLGAYGARFSAALGALAGGDASMLASPMKDSYHTLWFEFSRGADQRVGTDRATEEGSA